MDSVKYIGLNVHRDTISVAVVDQSGRLVMQSVIPTQGPCNSGLCGWNPGQLACHLGRRNAFGVGLRSTGAMGEEVSGVQSTQEHALEVGKQERVLAWISEPNRKLAFFEISPPAIGFEDPTLQSQTLYIVQSIASYATEPSRSHPARSCQRSSSSLS
jgi:hypothetical protein